MTGDEDSRDPERPGSEGAGPAATGESGSTPSRPVPDQRVVFVHVPKTAGMSLHAALEAWATPERSIRLARGGRDDLERLLGLSDAAVDHLRLISGHMSYRDFFKRLDDGWLAISVLRDPLERTLSLFSFVKNSPPHPDYWAVRGMDLDEFVEFDRERPYAVNQQCMFVANTQEADEAWEALTSRYALAAALEHLPAMIERLSELLDYPLEVGHQNVSASRLSKDDVGDATLQLIREANDADERLYRRALEAGLIGTLAGSDGA